SKLLIGPLHERVASAQSPNVMDGGANETKLKPNNMNAVEASSEEKATTMLAGSYAAPAGMDELKAPSPEAWQEPGPSTSAKEGKKVIISEVIEDGKSGESHTALRSLMSMEGKDKMDQAVPIPLGEIDPQSSSGKEASANVKKPKSRSRSFWSHCVCCPAVQ
ncbi:hypothetical protein L7F22_055889, partial [Adiantum nelumboides]|nr:hypothetical protein [Adiantum nelumboides]